MTPDEQRAYSRGYAAGRKKAGSEPSTGNQQNGGGQKTMAELLQLVAITRKRSEHLEIELAQAKASRDGYMEKYKKVSTWMKEHVQLARDGEVVISTMQVTPND